MKISREMLPGLGMAIVIGLAAYFGHGYVSYIDSVTLAIVIGIVIGNTGFTKRFGLAGTAYAEKKLLPLAIMLLGVQLDIRVLYRLGLPMMLFVITIMLLTMLYALGFGHLLGFRREFSLLMGTGNAVCGSSAIAAAAPVVKSSEEEIGIAVAIVNLMGTIGIFILPALAKVVDLGTEGAAAAIGGSLQAVGQVVAAGYSMGDNIGSLAVLVKMGRVLMLGPIVIGLGLIMRMRSSTGVAGKHHKAGVPGFIIGFFAFSLMASLDLLTPKGLSWISIAGKSILLVAMAGVGMRIMFATLLRKGGRSLALGTLIAVSQTASAVLLAWMLF